MSKRARQMQTDADRADLDRGCQIDGHATQCACGTFRTPGHTHKHSDTGPEPKGLAAKGHNGLTDPPPEQT